MRSVFVLVSVLLLVLGISGVVAEGSTMDEQVDQAFRMARAVGGAFVVAKDGRIVYERYYGEQQKSTHVPVTEKTYFKCASVTKFVTGIGLMRMMDQGILKPDEDISTYLGYPVAMAYVDAELAEPGTVVEADVRGRRVAAEIVKMPFYKRA